VEALVVLRRLLGEHTAVVTALHHLEHTAVVTALHHLEHTAVVTALHHLEHTEAGPVVLPPQVGFLRDLQNMAPLQQTPEVHQINGRPDLFREDQPVKA
jgi:hypothetical protein